jgi:alpha-L-fucosidase
MTPRRHVSNIVSDPEQAEAPMPDTESSGTKSSGTESSGTDWFDGAGLGLFVHWDHASQQGVEISWPLVGESIIPGHDRPEDEVSVERYHSTAATFDPVRWDAPALARLARAAGARYVVFTARHHAGYSMFHTRHSDFSVQHSPYGADITRQFVDAVRAQGLRVGIYYSLPDWHHPDYPAFRDADRPYPKERYPRPDPARWSRYLDYVKGQLTELLTGYGPIDLLWFDGEWERTEQEWQAGELRALIKSLQPDVIINDRLPGHGDYATPEQGMPVTPPAGPWELCLTMSGSWAWRPADTDYKSSRQLAEYLCEVVSRGGNLLLNVGPKGDGSLPEPEVARLAELGGWLDDHAESLIGVRPGPPSVDFHGPVTCRDDRIYLHLVLRPVDRLTVRGVPVRRVDSVWMLGSATPLEFRTNVEVHHQDEPGAEPTGELIIQVPGPTAALLDVIVIHLTEGPEKGTSPCPQPR